MIELERTFLVKTIPGGLENLQNKAMKDVYFPKDALHPMIRLRKDGNRYELTKKCPVNDGDASHQKEQTITLTKEEFDAISKLEGKWLKRYDIITIIMGIRQR